MNTIYQTSPIKRNRRTKADIAKIRAAIVTITNEYRRMTVRQVYYQLVRLEDQEVGPAGQLA